jgi:hypothetical protein
MRDGPCPLGRSRASNALLGLEFLSSFKADLEVKPRYIIRLIYATIEQSFLPRNSIRKVGCCVVDVAGREFGGLAPKPGISGRDAHKIAT